MLFMRLNQCEFTVTEFIFVLNTPGDGKPYVAQKHFINILIIPNSLNKYFILLKRKCKF